VPRLARREQALDVLGEHVRLEIHRIAGFELAERGRRERVRDERDLGSNLVLVFRAAPALLRYIVEKGSIAIAGVSLTVNAVDTETFSVAIIPHTRDATTLGELAIGDRVNLETDILAKHVDKLLGGTR